MDADFIMHMRARRESRAAHIGDDLTAPHLLSCVHDDGLRMAVARHDTIPMIDVDLIAVASCVPAGVCHHSVGCRYDGRAEVVGNVDARVEVRTIPAQAEGRTDLAACRPYRCC